MLHAGTARRDITPPPGTFLIGYGNRFFGNTRAREPLTVTALALRDGDTTAVLVACDLLAVTDATRDAVQSRVPAPVMIACSHTHSGPVTHADDNSPEDSQVYVHWLIEQIIAACEEALNQMHAVTLAHGQGRGTIAINRRQHEIDGTISIGYNPGGPVDKSLDVLQFRHEDGTPLATIVNYACHPTMLGPANRQASADWPGIMRGVVEGETGAPCLFVQGAGADLNPRLPHNPLSQWSDRFNLGLEVGRRAMTALDAAQPVSSLPLRVASSVAQLPVEPYTGEEAPEYAYRPVVAAFASVPRFMVDPLIHRIFPWAVTLTTTGTRTTVHMPLSALRIGDVLLMGMGAEVFTQIGMVLKQVSPAPIPLVASLTNGCIGYLPTPADHALGGYEVDIAPYFFRVPGRLSNGAADIAIDRTNRLARALWDG